MRKIIKKIALLFIGILGVLVFALVCFNFPVGKQNSKAVLGVTFSTRYATDIGLNWREAYTAMLDDLGVKKIRIPVYWDLVETKDDKFDFSDLDWQLEEAKKRNADVILVVGQKVPRWPECFIPEWANESSEKRKKALLDFIPIVINRYKDNSEIKYWQIENEPFLKFGICPPSDANLLDSEISLVEKLDPSRKIIITDSGELSLWTRAARRSDIFGTTMYRNIYKEGFGYYVYPLGPSFFKLKYKLIDFFSEQHNAIVVELQAEPWVSGWTTNAPIKEQFKSMNEEKLRENVEYARKVGFPEIYLWGVEWWYWLKEYKDHPEVWNEAKRLFKQ